MPSPAGAVFQRKRGDSRSLEEDVFDTLVEGFDDDLRAILDVFLPDGRPPFSVPLTKYEAWLRSMRATPEEWLGIVAQVSVLPQPERSEALADTFKQWSDVQIAKSFGGRMAKDGVGDMVSLGAPGE